MLAAWRHVMPYRWWLRLLRWHRVAPLRWIDALVVNVTVLGWMTVGRCRVFCRTSRDVWRWTEKLLSVLGRVVIEYDGTPRSISGRNLAREVHTPGKYLVSNMDWRPELGRRPQRFRQLVIGVDERLARDVSFESRPIDVLVIGTIGDVWPLRCECLERLLRARGEKYRIELHGFNKATPTYPRLSEVSMAPAYGRRAIHLMRMAKLTINVPSQEHLSIGSGMPTRTYEAAALGVVQVVVRTPAMRVTRFEEGRDYVAFSTPEQMLAQVDALLTDDARRVAMARCAHATFLAHHTAQRCFADLLDSVPSPPGKRETEEADARSR